jgi:hypothetical protein
MSDESNAQYSLVKILGIWTAAAVPMALLSWVVIQALAPDFKTERSSCPFSTDNGTVNRYWSHNHSLHPTPQAGGFAFDRYGWGILKSKRSNGRGG